MVSLLLSCMTLSFTTSRRFIPTLSRRIACSTTGSTWPRKNTVLSIGPHAPKPPSAPPTNLLRWHVEWRGHESSAAARRSRCTAAAILLTSAYYRTSSASIMTESANRLLVALSPEQRAKATFAFDDAERVNWLFIPSERKGLPLREMSPYQRHLARALLSAGLSQTGYIKAVTIMSLEDVLRVMEKDFGRAAQSGEILLLDLRHAQRLGHVGLPRGGPSRQPELHHRQRPRGGCAELLRRQSGRGARGSARRTARAGRRGGSGTRPDQFPRRRAEEDRHRRREGAQRHPDRQRPAGRAQRPAVRHLRRQDDRGAASPG